MIKVSKLDKTQVILSLDNVKYIESTPDTLIFFLNGESLMIRETLEEITERVIEYKSRVLKAADK